MPNGRGKDDSVTVEECSQYRTGDNEQVLENLEIIQILVAEKIDLFS